MNRNQKPETRNQQSNEPAAIRVDGVSKVFRLPREKHASLKSAFVNFYRRGGYDLQTALKNVSFEVKPGEFFGVIGRNGSGKSTLLKLLAGIYAPTKGRVQINGSLTPFIELGVGFNPELTGRENVFLNGALLGFNRKQMRALYDDIVEFAELERFMNQKLKNYSSGMQVRLAFSIAIRAHSDILLLDEVLAVGDAAFQKKCFDYFYQLKTDRKTVIFVSHNMDLVMRFCDRALLLDNGRLVQIGEPSDISDEYLKRNIAEADHQAAAASGRGRARKTAQLKSVKLLDGKGKISGELISGQPAAISIDYVINRPVEEFNIGIGLHAEAGGYIFGYNTQMDKVSLKKRRGTVRLQLDNLPLLKGIYFINVVAFGRDEAVPYDYLAKTLSFAVTSLGEGKLYRGLVNLKHDWLV
ncbi:ABC transporter ATP-binding protein [Candidatus Saccharibacteria bacterium]|nr:ABC transporter ATP-binding protein [Candidatus Saccharibacteria bacterium]